MPIYVPIHMKVLSHLYAIILAACAVACSSPSSFKVSGTLEPATSATVELTYYADGAMRREIASAQEGKFEIEGSSAAPTLGYINVAGGVPLAAVVVENGDNLKCDISITGGVWSARGNKASELLGQFASEHKEDIAVGRIETVNRAVADYVRNHPDEPGAAALLVSRFYARGYELQADSLAGMLTGKARAEGVMQNFMATMAAQLSSEANSPVGAMALFDRRDTTIRFSPARQSVALLAFVGTDKAMRDSILPSLRELSVAWPVRRCKVIEVSMASDSAEWKRSIERDSAEWTQAWAPGTVASSAFRKLAVSRIPFFIVADSVGKQLYRGSQLEEALTAVNNKLNTK